MSTARDVVADDLRTKCGAYQGSPTDADTDAAGILNAVRSTMSRWKGDVDPHRWDQISDEQREQWLVEGAAFIAALTTEGAE